MTRHRFEPGEARALERLAARAQRRRRQRLELFERVRLARLGLAHLWVSRRPWDRLELGHARSLESVGRRQLLAAWLGSWDQVGPQPATLTRRGLEAPELEAQRLAALELGAALVILLVVTALVILLVVAAPAWWRSHG